MALSSSFASQGSSLCHFSLAWRSRTPTSYQALASAAENVPAGLHPAGAWVGATAAGAMMCIPMAR
eukprot:CAMPEP_0179331852 /NCGR_PEP_ID=MMETSP0797-20121207/64412_1 /TAXON_ID=47934 /ORGANISM="Dinophysis acuminata, Strain DAEP01" /LENGTH=65 /DNA_ID=CAMNT_0021044663 /DNA_START=58 /DNA_END=255 /DNA_ORIENTATION=-